MQRKRESILNILKKNLAGKDIVEVTGLDGALIL
jgi:hypothetical protein